MSFNLQVSQRVHVGIWYILRAQRGSHIPTLRAKYTPYSYMDPLGIMTRGGRETLHSQGVTLMETQFLQLRPLQPHGGYSRKMMRMMSHRNL